MRIIPSCGTYQPPPPATTEGPAVSATSSSGTERRGETGRLINFAGIINMVVVGSTTDQAIGKLESHLRAIDSAPDSSNDLRQLRQQTEQAGVYPILAFEETPTGTHATLQRNRTARPGERIDLRTPPDSLAERGSRDEQEIHDLIGRVAGHWLRAHSEQSSDPAVLGPMPSGHRNLVEELHRALGNMALPPAYAPIRQPRDVGPLAGG